MSLIERLEAAEAGSGELDLFIDVELFGGEPWPGSDRVYRKDGNGYGYTQAVAPYTTSLDAALALAERVLPGWAIEVAKVDAGETRSAANIWVPSQRSEISPSSDRVFVKAATPALALCTAILKAKETK